MPEILKNQFVHIVNKNNPDLNDITDNIFDAAERYSHACKHIKSSPKNKHVNSHVLAVNIGENTSVRPKECSICGGGHHISACDKFLSAKEKTDKLREIKRCTKCGGPNHNAGKCKFNFYKPCFHCGVKSHFSYLCLSKDNKNNKVSKLNHSKPLSVNANCLTLGSRHSEDVILPTFTIGVKNGYMIRALKDTGCTNCFIRKSLAKMLNCKILDRITVTIKGMNINRLHEAEVVEVKILIGNKAVSVSAITIEKITIDLNVPQLSIVVRGYKERGYKFADEYLNNSDKVDNIEFILGSW